MSAINAKDLTGALPPGIGASRKWWFTHERLRSAYTVLNTAGRRGHLFTFLEPGLLGLGVNATTNMIEGAIISGIRAMIFHHRGMPTEHRRRAVEWFCWSHADPAARPPLGELPELEHYTPHVRTPAQAEEDTAPVGPALYGTAATAEEGLYSRQGWAGRNQ